MAQDKCYVFRGTASVNDTALQIGGVDYTPGQGRMFVIRAAAFFNGNAAIQQAKLKAGETYITSLSLEPSAACIEDCMNALVLSGEKIMVKAGVDNDIKYRVWGTEMDI